MSNPILPTIITSPAIVTWNGKSFYSKAGIRSAFKRDTFRIETDFDGVIDERMKAQRTEVTFQPDGQISDLNKYFPYAVSDIGKSIFGTTNKPLVIVTKFGGSGNAGQTITYPRAALSHLPQLRLRATDTLFGEMSFTCLGNPNVQSNSATAWQTMADAAFGDASFDETKIVTDIYRAAYGSSPYDAIGSMTGFEVDIAMATETVDADDFGQVDMILKSLAAAARFAPGNLTEPQVVTLLALQNTGYVFPGQSLAKANTDLVIAGSGNNGLTLTVTIKNAGPRQATFVYAASRHRFEALEFTSKRTWTSGAANALFTLAIT